MAIDIEREPTAFPVQDDPMRAFGNPRNGSRPVAQIGDPAPLGLATLGLTLMVFSMFNAGLLASSGEPVVLGMALAYGGVVQLLAGMWEVRRGNSFGALTFASFGAFSVSFGLLEQFFLRGIPAGAHSELVKVGGWFGLAATAAALYGAFAGAINGTYARTLLPLVPLQRERTTG